MRDHEPQQKSREESHEGGTPENWLTRETLLTLVLAIATAVSIWLCYLLAQPFLPALAWALALAVVAHPIHTWIASRVKSDTVSAGLSVLLVAILIIAPVVFVAQQLTRELSSFVNNFSVEQAAQKWQELMQSNPRVAPAMRWVEEQVFPEDERGRKQATQALRQGAAAATSRFPSVLSGSVWAVTQLLITLFTLFYFFRDRRYIGAFLRSLLPLSNSETDEVFSRVQDTIVATVFGSLSVAVVQGTLGGLMFYFLGLPTPVLWGAVMTLLAVIPMLGTFVIWGPTAIILALQGEWGKALALVAWGGTAIALIDNLLYPFLVGRRLRLHTLAVFFSLVGGLALFGAAGLILGPLVLALTDAFFDIWRRRTAGGKAAADVELQG